MDRRNFFAALSLGAGSTLIPTAGSNKIDGEFSKVKGKDLVTILENQQKQKSLPVYHIFTLDYDYNTLFKPYWIRSVEIPDYYPYIKSNDDGTKSAVGGNWGDFYVDLYNFEDKKITELQMKLVEQFKKSPVRKKWFVDIVNHQKGEIKKFIVMFNRIVEYGYVEKDGLNIYQLSFKTSYVTYWGQYYI